jgi:hypothetical protein
MAVEERRIVAGGVRVECHDCSTTVAEVRAGLLILKQRHHGVVHVTALSLRDLIRLLEEQEQEAA